MEKNHRAFQRLINRYETITLEEIENVWGDLRLPSDYVDFVAKELTGFGCMNSCTLCLEIFHRTQKPVKNDKEICQFCVYSKLTSSTDSFYCIEALRQGDNSYNDILNSRTPKELYNAYKARAEEMKIFYNENYPQKKQ